MVNQAENHVTPADDRASTTQPKQTKQITRLKLSARWVQRVLLIITAIFTTLSLIGILAIYNPFFEKFRRLFEFDQEQSISTWYSGALLLLGSIIVAVIAQDHIRRKRPYARHWLYLSLIFTLMSLDEVAGLHEQLIQFGDAFNTSGIFLFAWVIPGLVIVTGFAIAYFKFTLNLPAEIRFMFVFSLGLFVFGAVGMEMVNGAFLSYTDVESPIPYILLTTLEETLEKVGIVLFIGIMLKYLQDYCTIAIRFDDRIPVQTTTGD